MVFWIFGFNTHLLDTTARNMAVHVVRTIAKMDRTIKKAATECEICGGFFVYGHILLGSAVTISGKNHKIASASTIKQK